MRAKRAPDRPFQVMSCAASAPGRILPPFDAREAALRWPLRLSSATTIVPSASTILSHAWAKRSMSWMMRADDTASLIHMRVIVDHASVRRELVRVVLRQTERREHVLVDRFNQTAEERAVQRHDLRDVAHELAAVVANRQSRHARVGRELGVRRGKRAHLAVAEALAREVLLRLRLPPLRRSTTCRSGGRRRCRSTGLPGSRRRGSRRSDQASALRNTMLLDLDSFLLTVFKRP